MQGCNAVVIKVSEPAGYADGCPIMHFGPIYCICRRLRLPRMNDAISLKIMVQALTEFDRHAASGAYMDQTGTYYASVAI